MDTQWILESNGCYFEKWVLIGPLCTPNIEKAHRFNSRLDAIYDASRHFGLLLYEPIELPARAKSTDVVNLDAARER